MLLTADSSPPTPVQGLSSCSIHCRGCRAFLGNAEPLHGVCYLGCLKGVSKSVCWHSCSYGTDFEDSEIASPVVSSISDYSTVSDSTQPKPDAAAQRTRMTGFQQHQRKIVAAQLARNVLPCGSLATAKTGLFVLSYSWLTTTAYTKKRGCQAYQAL